MTRSVIVDTLREYLDQFDSVLIAYLFGSRAKGFSIRESDLDIAVYFKPKSETIEIESAVEYEKENEIWSGIERKTGIPVDLLVLNRAPATLVYTVFEEGIPIVVRDGRFYWRLYLTVSKEAEDFRDFSQDFWKIKQRSSSLSEIEKDRLLRIIDFLESELADYQHFTDLDKEKYHLDHNERRNAERFVENIVNASIDCAKILLASDGYRIPQTYKEALSQLSLMKSFPRNIAEQLSNNARLRNILAHEYLDIKFKYIKTFMEESESVYKALIDYAKSKLKETE